MAQGRRCQSLYDPVWRRTAAPPAAWTHRSPLASVRCTARPLADRPGVQCGGRGLACRFHLSSRGGVVAVQDEG